MKQPIKDIEVVLGFIRDRRSFRVKQGIYGIVLVMMVGCASSSTKRQRISEEDLLRSETSEVAQRDPFRVGSQTKLLITVRNEPDLTQEVMVRSDGTIDYAYVGKIQVQGFTLSEIEGIITHRLKNYMMYPTVTVKVKEFGIVYILGKVKNPGILKLEEHETALQALAAAGGFGVGAEKARLRVIRNISGQKKKIEISLRETEDGGIELVDSLYLLPGDTVIVE